MIYYSYTYHTYQHIYLLVISCSTFPSYVKRKDVKNRINIYYFPNITSKSNRKLFALHVNSNNEF